MFGAIPNMLATSRRSFLGFLAAPAIVKATSIMPVRGLIMAAEAPIIKGLPPVPIKAEGPLRARYIQWWLRGFDIHGVPIIEMVKAPMPEHP